MRYFRSRNLNLYIKHDSKPNYKAIEPRIYIQTFAFKSNALFKKIYRSVSVDPVFSLLLLSTPKLCQRKKEKIIHKTNLLWINNWYGKHINLKFWLLLNNQFPTYIILELFYKYWLQTILVHLHLTTNCMHILNGN